MPSITITDGYTFNNWGPLTTTFTAPASCATFNDYIIRSKEPIVLSQFAAQCSTIGYYHDCIPTGTTSLPTSQSIDPYTMYDQAYYSPGLHCPSGWKTVGVAARDGDKSVSSSGVLSVASPTETITGTVDIPKQLNPVTLLGKVLDPSETLVICCPSSMTADLDVGGCYSTASAYKPSIGCAANLPISDFGTSTKTHVVNGTTSTELLLSLTSSHPMTAVTTTFAASDVNDYIALSVLPMIPLVHHQSDLKDLNETGTSGAGSTKTGSITAASTTAPSTSTSTPNSAARIAPRVNLLNGLGSVLTVSLAASVLGAAVIFS
ncbi:uncharacterized protein N7479_001386 [Penicillium vulpinum]|uniref:Uncharacterized protein n=1 Tax=Penicillium vulpinum TaxID=29845 RepID=A0A1V6RUK6_9EURO|nr:uncharacterized protein N7479_001386 [Penicillium vulpinum]KAJ5971468.1 hypothetical protein N7479_001386 [Penicillium vulpinum]OQE05184.1 hypothetical protein PENVUL_c026G00717 [Penicillium vulpinum]